jgi:WD40 repeat protein
MGTAGSGGSVVSCGSAVGTPPAPAGAPTLANCVEYDHNAAGGTCNPDPAVDINNHFINDVVVSPDGQLLATSGNDSSANAIVKVWRLQNNVPIGQCSVFSRAAVGPAFVAFSPDGQYFAIAWNGDYVYTYHVPDFLLVGEAKSSPNPLYGVGFSADSKTVLSIDWDGLDNGTLYADQPDGTAISQQVLGVDPDFFTVSPVASGGVTTMAVAGYNGNFGVYTWNGSAFTGPIVRTTVAGAAGSAIRFSRDGLMLAEGTNDGSIRFWNVPITNSSAPSGAAITIGDIPFGLSFSALGDQIAVGFGSEIDTWSVSTRAMLGRHGVVAPPGGTIQYVDSTTFSASGSAVVVGEDKCGKFLICSD